MCIVSVFLLCNTDDSEDEDGDSSMPSISATLSLARKEADKGEQAAAALRDHK